MNLDEKLDCECGVCGREHGFFGEYMALMKITGGAESFKNSRLIILLKDCDNGGYPFFLIAETENLKMGISLPRGAEVMEFMFGEFQPLSKTVWN